MDNATSLPVLLFSVGDIGRGGRNVDHRGRFEGLLYQAVDNMPPSSASP